MKELEQRRKASERTAKESDKAKASYEKEMQREAEELTKLKGKTKAGAASSTK